MGHLKSTAQSFMPRHARSLVAGALLLVGVGARPAHAQLLGTFTWQQQPYCNRLTVTITSSGEGYAVDGYDDQCGGTLRSSVFGTSVVNGDGTVGLGLTVITAPGGAPSHIDARVNPSSGNGTWTDDAGASGAFVLGAAAAGSPRPRPATRNTWGLSMSAASAFEGPGISLKVESVPLTAGSAALSAQFGLPSTLTGAGAGNAAVSAHSFGQTAILGMSDTAYGVRGVSKSGYGVYGESDNVGVFGLARGSGPGVIAWSQTGKSALRVVNGSITVGGYTRPAFTHTTTASNTSGHATTLDHPLLNGDPNALLFVMHDYVSGATVNDAKEKSVWYDTALAKWRIYHDDLSAMPLNVRFNVLVISACATVFCG